MPIILWLLGVNFTVVLISSHWRSDAMPSRDAQHVIMARFTTAISFAAPVASSSTTCIAVAESHEQPQAVQDVGGDDRRRWTTARQRNHAARR